MADPNSDVDFEWNVNSTGKSGDSGINDLLLGKTLRKGVNLITSVVEYTPKVI